MNQLSSTLSATTSGGPDPAVPVRLHHSQAWDGLLHRTANPSPYAPPVT